MKKEELFNQIIADNKDRLRRICSYYNADRQEQKDMFQEILINIWNSLDRFRGEAATSTYIYRIAVNTAISYVGKLNKRLKISVHIDPQSLNSLFDDEHSEEWQLKEKQFETLHLELNMLSIIDKTIMSLVLEGLSTKEIADVIGITEPNVRVKIHRIKSELKTKLTGANDGNE